MTVAGTAAAIEMIDVTIGTTSLPDGTLSQAYSTVLTASGGHGTFLWSETGALPPGLTSEESSRDAAPDSVLYAVASSGADVARLARAPAQAAALSYLLAVGGRATVEEINAAVPGARATLKKLAFASACTRAAREPSS